jgi:hypothetical protein
MYLGFHLISRASVFLMRESCMRKLLFLGLVLTLIVAGSTVVYADPFKSIGAQLTIDSIHVSSDGKWVLVAVTVRANPNGQLSGQILLSLESSFPSKGGLKVFDTQSTVTNASNVVRYTFTVPFQGAGHYKFVAKAFTYPSLSPIGSAVADPPAVGRK